MKSLYTILFLGVFVFATAGAGVAHAQDATDGVQRPAGITPGNPLFVVDRFFERVTLALTRGDTARARRLAAYAEERASELRELAESTADDAADRRKQARGLYEGQLDELEDFAEKAEDASVEETVADATSKHIAVFERVRKQVPEEARASIERAITRARTGETRALDALAVRAPERLAKVGLQSARRRLQSARQNAEDGDVADAERILSEFETIFQKVRTARQAGDTEHAAEIAENFSERVADVIDEFDEFEDLPENVRERMSARIELLKDLAINDHVDALRRLADKNPERAAELYAEAAKRRAEAAEKAAKRRAEAAEKAAKRRAEAVEERAKRVRERVEEFEKYSAFGEEISDAARRLRTDEATVDELVERATERHREVLQRVREQVPEEAHEDVDRALENNERLRERIETQTRTRTDDGETETRSRFRREAETENGSTLERIRERIKTRLRTRTPDADDTENNDNDGGRAGELDTTRSGENSGRR